MRCRKEKWIESQATHAYYVKPTLSEKNFQIEGFVTFNKKKIGQIKLNRALRVGWKCKSEE